MNDFTKNYPQGDLFDDVKDTMVAPKANTVALKPLKPDYKKQSEHYRINVITLSAENQSLRQENEALKKRNKNLNEQAITLSDTNVKRMDMIDTLKWQLSDESAQVDLLLFTNELLRVIKNEQQGKFDTLKAQFTTLCSQVNDFITVEKETRDMPTGDEVIKFPYMRTQMVASKGKSSLKPLVAKHIKIGALTNRMAIKR